MEAANNSALHKKPCAEYAATHCSAYQDQTKVMNIALLYAQRETLDGCYGVMDTKHYV